MNESHLARAVKGHILETEQDLDCVEVKGDERAAEVCEDLVHELKDDQCGELRIYVLDLDLDVCPYICVLRVD